MTEHSYQEILSLVTTPSRYLGTETNRIKKDLDKVDLKIALAFPDLYEIGTSHFGIQILYSILNGKSDIAAERVYCPSVDMQRMLSEKNIPLLSLENSVALKNFDIVGFSLLYELNYTNILTMLSLSGIPFLAEERDDSCPIIIAGGPCACNAEPVARIFDAVVFGDGERVVLEMAEKWLECKKKGCVDKKEIVWQWRQIEGVYVPSLFKEKKIKIDNNETIVVEPLEEDCRIVNRAVLSDLNRADFPEKPIVPFSKPVHDRLRMEIARGCARGCRFCQAGMIYRPVRERNGETVVRLTEKCLRSTGYDDISLLSLSTGDYCRIEQLLTVLMQRWRNENVAVSLPSLRVGTLTPKLMELIKKVRKTGFTLAPEAGSQRLRDVINKNITEDQIFETVENAVGMGWKVIKLYFMTGLPTETQDDIEETIELIKRIGQIKSAEKRKIQINASFTTFIPKPHTPFQWAGQASMEYATETIDHIKSELLDKNIHVKWQNPETSRIDGLFARGDRRLTDLLIQSWKNGCRLDGWSDHFRYDLWMKSASETGIDVDFYTVRQRSLDEPLPWDHMNSRVEKQFLIAEWRKGLKGEFTDDCRTGECQNCGVCDFKNVKPVAADNPSIHEIADTDLDPDNGKSMETKKLMASYMKTGPAKYFGHLEMVNIFLRAMRRAKIPVVFSGGFHPMPKVSFQDPLPVGMESLRENFFVVVRKDHDSSNMAEKLTGLLPEGLVVTECVDVDSNRKFDTETNLYYLAESSSGIFSEKRLKEYEEAKEFNFIKKNKKGRTKSIDLKKTVEKIVILNKNRVLLNVKNEPGKNVRPSELLTNIFGLSEEVVRQTRVIKLDIGKDSDVQTTGDQRF